MTTPKQPNAAQIIPKVIPVTDEMVERFLGWKLPDNFHPDTGISFDAEKCKSGGYWPHGTCLLDAHQARSMLEHVLAVVQPKDSAVIAQIELKKDDKDIVCNFSSTGAISEIDEASVRHVLLKLCEEMNERLMERVMALAYQKGRASVEQEMD